MSLQPLCTCRQPSLPAGRPQNIRPAPQFLAVRPSVLAGSPLYLLAALQYLRPDPLFLAVKPSVLAGSPSVPAGRPLLTCCQLLSACWPTPLFVPTGIPSVPAASLLCTFGRSSVPAGVPLSTNPLVLQELLPCVFKRSPRGLAPCQEGLD
jgi:hypothetical protein